ncbi:MAG: hypothetical protein SFV54_12315 [Bryobacteraceae bacterium]|nr:hypothetical protein [Bryobacteraceae bacterium]
MFKDRLKAILGTGAAGDAGVRGAPGSGAKRASNSADAPFNRQSPGLDQFFASIRDTLGLSLLDCAGASQANISFITGLGHRIYSEDVVRTLGTVFGQGEDFYGSQEKPELIEEFLTQTLTFNEGQFDGALIWDSFQFMQPALLAATIARLRVILRPNAYLLAFFHADERAVEVPSYSYRIVDYKTLQLTRRGARPAKQFFNNRALERLFQEFQSVKFFLTRDSLREVIVKR